MQHPIEICLTACEWVERKRGKAAAGWTRREAEEKTIWTFLSQGAVGGAVGYFVVVTGAAISYPAAWNPVYCVLLPMFLVFGATLGSIAAILIWLTGVVFQRRLNFIVRTVIVTGFLALLGALQFHLTQGMQTEQWSTSAIVASLYVLKLPIVLMTGSRVRPGHLIVLGAGPRSPRYNLGSWLSLPAGFVLRVVSIFGLLEALMLLAFWISNGWSSLEWSPPPQHLPAIVLALLYFAAGSYLSIRTPRKGFLLPTIVLLNIPLAGLIVHVSRLDAPVAYFLYYFLLMPICLWVVYALGRLVAPESAGRLVSTQPARRVAGSWPEEVAILKLSARRACQVQT